MGTKYISHDIPVKWPGIQIISKILSKEISKEKSDTIMATSNGNIGFSTSHFSHLFEKVTTGKDRSLWFIANLIKGKREILFEESAGNTIYKNTW